MSNKSRLQTNNINLQALVNKANALPDAGGSGSMRTCTITINSASYIDFICATTMVDGKLSSYWFSEFNGSYYSKTIENVVCDTTIGLNTYVVMPVVSSTGSAEATLCGNGYFSIKAPSVAGENCTITITSGD